MSRFFVMAALLCFVLSCTSQQSADAEKERKARVAVESINAAKRDGEFHILVNEKRMVYGDEEVVKSQPKFKLEEGEIVTLKVVDNE